MKTITSADQLPERYANGLGFPRLDWYDIQDACSAGAQFAGHGVQVNAEHARQRLVKAGLMQDHTKGETDGND